MFNHVKPILVLVPIALLAACGKSNDTATADGATATATATPDAATPVAAATPISYDCLPAQRLTASYDNSGATPKATLTLDGKTYELTSVQAADGAKYATDQGRSAGKTLVWWTKGPDGTLLEGKVGGSASDEAKLAECSPSIPA